MDVDSSKTANKRIRMNCENEEVVTLLGVWESHTKKQGAVIFGELSKQMQDNAYVTSADNNNKKAGWTYLHQPTHPHHHFLETHHWHGQNTEIIITNNF